MNSERIDPKKQEVLNKREGTLNELTKQESVKFSNNGIPFSISVSNIIKNFSEEVSASDIVNFLLDEHPHYANGKAKGLHVKGADKKKSAQNWINDVLQLFKEIPRLNGKLIILGLSLIDMNLRTELISSKFLDDLVEEIKKEHNKSIESILSNNGGELWRGLHDKHDNTSVPIHSDAPSEIDRLSRKAFAQALANHLRNILDENKQSNNNGVFLLNITGPWGSGKSSLLRYLDKCLSGSGNNNKLDMDKWIVVNFNAWQHQHLDPPWWSLMGATYREARRKLGFWSRPSIELWFKEQKWRLFSLQPIYSLFFWIFVLLTILIFAFPITTKILSMILNVSTDNLEWFSKAFTLVGLAVSTFKAVHDSLILGSSSAARNYIQNSQNPLDNLSEHFKDLVKWIPRPIAIFIDDLDRCQDKYVVELLEGIQTLFCRDFSNKSVIYIIAADRRWLYTSYKNNYSSFCNSIEETGRSLDQMFLEKTFQLTVTIPRLSSKIQNDYWKYLIGFETPVDPEEVKKDREKAKKNIQEKSDPTEIMKNLSELSRGRETMNYNQFYREEAIIQLSKSLWEKTYTKHLLEDFAPFLNSNPRQMKRLVNAYRIQRDIAILYGLDTKDESLRKLALWTIVTLQWPALAEYLQDSPEAVHEIKEDSLNLELLPENVKIILSNLNESEKVRGVLKGRTGHKDIKVSLDEESIRLFTEPVT